MKAAGDFVTEETILDAIGRAPRPMGPLCLVLSPDEAQRLAVLAKGAGVTICFAGADGTPVTVPLEGEVPQALAERFPDVPREVLAARLAGAVKALREAGVTSGGFVHVPRPCPVRPNGKRPGDRHACRHRRRHR